MGYSIHIPVFLGTIKIKSASRLRREEQAHLVPMRRIGNAYVVWSRRKKRKDAAAPFYGKTDDPPPVDRE